MDGLLDILDKDWDFKHFMLDGQTIVLDDYLHMRPEREGVLRQHIQAGRIQIGPWHILPDLFLVSPEAHIRNLLEGARTTCKFGPRMPVGYIPDSFGHPGQLPQILKGFGLDAAALWRGLGDVPAELWWESPDGSRILLAYLRDSYSNGANLPVHDPELFARHVAMAGSSLAAHSAVDDHLIMLGTDHMEPSPHTSAAITYANSHLPDTRVVHSTLPAYIQSITEQISDRERPLPTLRGELRACDRSHLLPGVLSSRMWIKQRNHRTETLLERWAEPFSVFAASLIPEGPTRMAGGQRAPEVAASKRLGSVAPILRQAWRLVMENHPHDSICGCSIDQVHDEMRPRFDQADQIGEELTLHALRALSQATATQSKDAFSALVLFNPLGSRHHDVVDVELSMPEGVAAFELVDENGAVLPHEFLSPSSVEVANVLLEKRALRDTLGAAVGGRVAGAAIVHVKVSRQGAVVTIEAVLDDEGQPNLQEWQRAEDAIVQYEADPGITHFRVMAHTPRASRIRFVSPDIPALGWRTVWARALAAPETRPAVVVHPLLRTLLPLGLRLARSGVATRWLARMGAGDEPRPPYEIENEYFRVEASRTDGTLAVTDKRTGAVFAGLNRFVDGGDAGDEYNYSPPPEDAIYTAGVVSLKAFRHRRIPFLEIRYALRVPAQLSADRNSRSGKQVSMPILSRVSLAPGVPRIDVQTEVVNKAKDHRLRVHFPAPLAVSEADHDGHFEVVRRPVGVPERGETWIEAPRPEVPQRAFTDVSNGAIGLMLANRGLPEVEVRRADDDTRSELALTLLRCEGWLSRDDLPGRRGHAGPGVETPGAQLLGTWSYDYAIIPHEGGWRDACQQAYAFQSPLRALEAGIHPGGLPFQGSFISHSPDEFIISAVKETENGKGWLVRGYNVSAEVLRVRLRPLRRFAYASRINLAEEDLAALTVEDGGSTTLSVGGHEIVTIAFWDAGA
jgi:mannosylglycerate hydrolase